MSPENTAFGAIWKFCRELFSHKAPNTRKLSKGTYMKVSESVGSVDRFGGRYKHLSERVLVVGAGSQSDVAA